MDNLLKYSRSGIFIQIGAGAGDLDTRSNKRDGFAEFIKKIDKNRIKQIILVEPNIFNIDLLKECYKDFENVIIVQKLIVPKTINLEKMDLYYCEEDGPNYQTASIIKEHVLKHYPNRNLEKIEVDTINLENLIEQYCKDKEIELLSLDIEGIDEQILLDLNLNKINVKNISFEYIHLGDKVEDVKNHLEINNFIFKGIGIDHSGFDWLYTKNNIFPINFSFSSYNICKNVPKKEKILSNLIPGKLCTYIYNNQEEYYKEYQKSMFAITKKKAGWDCMRHYEIIFNYCLPVFEDIENCPNNIMTFMPKELLNKINIFYNNIKDIEFHNLTNNELDEYNIYQNLLINYAKNNLTSIKIAEYILNKTNNNNSNKILYLSGSKMPDYLRCLTLHGFKEKFGSNCHDYIKIEHLYKDIEHTFKYEDMSSKGFSYSNLLEYNKNRNDNLDNTVEEDIKNKKYDLIIYGSINRGLPFIDLVKNIYPKNKIIFLDGEDHNHKIYDEYNCDNYIFVRELY